MTVPICTGKAEVSLHPRGHIVIRVYENSDVDLHDIKAIHEAKARLAAGEKHTVLFITPMIGNISKAAREFAASAACNHQAIAKAVVARSMASRLIANFFINYHKPETPTRVFSCEEAASCWLADLEKETEK